MLCHLVLIEDLFRILLNYDESFVHGVKDWVVFSAQNVSLDKEKASVIYY